MVGLLRIITSVFGGKVWVFSECVHTGALYSSFSIQHVHKHCLANAAFHVRGSHYNANFNSLVEAGWFIGS